MHHSTRCIIPVYQERVVPRVARIWQRAQDGWWYCTRNGEKVKFARDRGEARRAFHTLMSEAADPDEAGATARVSGSLPIGSERVDELLNVSTPPRMSP
jgi:hypothetical protein